MHDIHFFTAIEPARRTITLARFARADHRLVLNLVRWSSGLLQEGVTDSIACGDDPGGLDLEGVLGGPSLSATQQADRSWDLSTRAVPARTMRFSPVGARRSYPDLDQRLPLDSRGYREQPCEVLDDGARTGAALHGYRQGSPMLGGSWQWLYAVADDDTWSLSLFRVRQGDQVAARGYVETGGSFVDVRLIEIVDPGRPAKGSPAAGIVHTPGGRHPIEAHGEGQTLLASPFPGFRVAVSQTPVRIVFAGRAGYGILEDTRHG